MIPDAKDTRSRLLELLRAAPRTVAELAEALGVTPGAVRFHLSSLARDGWVRQTGLRPSARRPAIVYELAAERASAFHRGHAPVLDELLEVLTNRMGSRRAKELLDLAGRSIARSAGTGGSFNERVRIALRALEELGALVETEETEGALVVRGADCPLGRSPLSHPELCAALRGLLAEVVGVPVREQCERSDRARCTFQISKPKDDDRGADWRPRR